MSEGVEESGEHAVYGGRIVIGNSVTADMAPESAIVVLASGWGGRVTIWA